MDTPKKQSIIRDILGIVLFLGLVFIGYLIINSFIFRSFNVDGPSSEKTLYTGDKLIVNELPVSFAHLSGQQYLPKRGQFIVFQNPDFSLMGRNEYIVKRVVAFSGEKVVVSSGKVTVYNKAHSNGFDPDTLTSDREGSPTSGDVVRTVPKNELFVLGDHREGNFSLDSRNGLGTIPLNNIIGPVAFRIFPFQDFRSF